MEYSIIYNYNQIIKKCNRKINKLNKIYIEGTLNKLCIIVFSYNV